MDSVQRDEVKKLKHVLKGIGEQKCIPCRFVFFFSVLVFVGVLIFVMYVRARDQASLAPIPQELAPKMSPSEYERGLLRLENVFHPNNLSSSGFQATSSLSNFVTGTST